MSEPLPMRELTKEEIRSVCMVCKVVYANPEGTHDSHGLCPEHYEKTMADIRAKRAEREAAMSVQYEQCNGPTGRCLLPLGHGGDHWRMPSSETVRKTDAAMALTAVGRCPFCKSAVPSGEQCKCWNKEND